MSNAPNEESNRSSASLHLQILLVGTVLFLAALFSLATLPHTNTPDQASMAGLRIFAVLKALGGYLAFVGLVFGHKTLR